MAKIAVIGAGYVGLTTSACLAHLGHSVTCVDVDAHKIHRLNSGGVPIVEDRLTGLILEGTDAGRLRFVIGANTAVVDCEFVFLCVPTPEGRDGQADLSHIEAATSQIATVLPHDAVVVNKSTAPIGTAKNIERILQRPDVYVVSNPEFLRQGTAVYDFLNPDRIVVGSRFQEAALRVAHLYDKLDAPILITDCSSAEMIKYAANAFLATKLSFVNAVASICEGLGADTADVMRGVGYDQRIGHDFLKPGPGWGGSCFPKDTIALLRIAESINYDFSLLKSVLETNEEQFERTSAKISSGLEPPATVAVWGLTYKALTDDIRNSPSLEIISRLTKRGFRIRAFDPTVRRAIDSFPSLEVCDSEVAACTNADVLAVLTEWEDFRHVDPVDVRRVMVRQRVVDARNLLDRLAWELEGFEYIGVGQ